MRVLDSQKFSTRRINCLLRPLRNRCTSLASCYTDSGSRSGLFATYSSRTSSVSHTDDSDFPPLSVLQPPMNTGARIHFAKHRIESLEISRKLYAIRDCFQEIVSKTDGKETAGIRRVMSLAAICSIVVGENMQCEVNMNSDAVEDANIFNDIYEAVPLHYRRFALLSHATNLVLNTTIHHPTLLNILLDVTLSHGLLYESNRVLHALFFVALSPLSSGAMPPICHPAHSVFLLELYTRWISGGFRGQMFSRILAEVLHAIHSQEAWGCKALHKFANAICGSDFPSFMELAGGCTSMASKLDRSNRRMTRTRKLRQQDDSSVAILLWSRIQQWLNIACEHCITAEESSMENSDVVFAFLELSLSSNLHHGIYSVDNADILHADLQGSVVCLATYWLTSPFILNSQGEWIAKRLEEITPRSSTYVTLVTKSLAKSSLSVGQSKLRSLAMALRLHELLRLESSLWACALRHIECLASEHLFGSRNGIHEIRAYRDSLIELVDDAERRCFGVGSSSSGSHHGLSGHAKVRGRLNYEWQWEATLGCWVRRDNGHTQPKKKRKVEPAEMISLGECRSLRLRHMAGDIGMQNPSTTTGIVRTGHIRGSLAGSSVTQSQNGGEYRHASVPLHRSSATFTSLLADAFSQRTVLHDKTTQDQDIKLQLSMQPICLSPLPNSSLSGHEVLTLPSDDSLDLFVCEASY